MNQFRHLKANTGFIKYFKNTSWLFGEKILRMIIGLFVGVWVARYLGPEQFGLFSYALSFVGLFTIIATLGLDEIVIRELVKDESRRDELIGTAFWLKLIGALLVFLLLAIAVNFTSNDSYTNTLVFIIASATVFQSFNVIDLYYQATVMGKYITYANVISLLLSTFVKVIFIIYEAPLIAFAWTIVFENLVLAVGYLYLYIQNRRLTPHNTKSILPWMFNKQTAISLLQDSWPLILSGMVIAVYMRIDQIMIKEMLGNEAVGQYAAAVRISEAWYFIPIVIASSLFPAILNAKQISQELYYERLQKLYNLMAWISMTIALPMTFLSDWIINLLYGGQFDQAGSVLMIHIWSGIFVFLGVASGKWLISENLTIFSSINTSLGAILNIVLNYMLIPSLGIKGAAWATLIAYCLAAYLSLSFFKKTRINFFYLSKSLFFSGIRNVKKNH